ncbi:MAG TPA: TIGR04255 family protein [Candidatus Saccharicenans sp.]|nr:TIGR04255 family protein [Candidatus Saccharicenans sp.]HQM75184.1 TIGR04255 family protein [Candidatus Saccharicenans sp.]
MERKILKNKPLVEAIFEVRWELQGPVPGMKIDPHYKILIGRIYDRVKDEYPFHTQLPTIALPDEIAAYVVQHQFRKDKDQWPLIQIGPGIITLNDTEGYTWEDFEKRMREMVAILFEAYPDAENNLKINQLLLRYIDAINFNYQEENIFSFLRENFKVNIDIYEKLFEETGVSDLPLGFDLRFSFPATKPKSAVHLRFVRGKKKEEDALIWETQVQSVGDSLTQGKEQIVDWGVEAHKLTDSWFFKMIEGELLRRFE